jgi:hypothetical protein
MDDGVIDPRACSLSEAFDQRAWGLANAGEFAEPQPAGPVPRAEPPTPCGWPLLDRTLGGLLPGSVTMLRSRWAEASPPSQRA